MLAADRLLIIQRNARADHQAWISCTSSSSSSSEGQQGQRDDGGQDLLPAELPCPCLPCPEVLLLLVEVLLLKHQSDITVVHAYHKLQRWLQHPPQPCSGDARAAASAAAARALLQPVLHVLGPALLPLVAARSRVAGAVQAPTDPAPADIISAEMQLSFFAELMSNLLATGEMVVVVVVVEPPDDAITTLQQCFEFGGS